MQSRLARGLADGHDDAVAQLLGQGHLGHGAHEIAQGEALEQAVGVEEERADVRTGPAA
ncbi:MAG: hypothetical protein ACLT4Y_09040 [Bifidobacterium breve]